MPDVARMGSAGLIGLSSLAFVSCLWREAAQAWRLLLLPRSPRTLVSVIVDAGPTTASGQHARHHRERSLLAGEPRPHARPKSITAMGYGPRTRGLLSSVLTESARAPRNGVATAIRWWNSPFVDATAGGPIALADIQSRLRGSRSSSCPFQVIGQFRFSVPDQLTLCSPKGSSRRHCSAAFAPMES